MVRSSAVLGAVAFGAPAPALDVAAQSPPVAIDDGVVQIGPRSLRLPPGHWFLVDSSSTPVQGGPRNLVTESVDTAYVVQVEDRAFVLGARISMLRNDLAVRSWRSQPCKGDDSIYAKSYATLSLDCVSIDGKRAGMFEQYVRTYTPRTADWLLANHVRPPDTTIGIRYTRGSDDTFGSIVLVVPAEHFDSDATAEAWVASLRSALMALFEHRTDQARLPSLPEPTPTPTAGAPAASAP